MGGSSAPMGGSSAQVGSAVIMKVTAHSQPPTSLDRPSRTAPRRSCACTPVDILSGRFGRERERHSDTPRPLRASATIRPMRYAVWNNKGGVGKSFLSFVLGTEVA